MFGPMTTDLISGIFVNNDEIYIHTHYLIGQ